MLMQAKKVENETEARTMLETAVHNGSALQKLIDMVEAQHGDIQMIKHTETLPQAKEVLEIKSREEGYVEAVHALSLGTLAMQLGAGRQVKEDIIDPSVGIVLQKKDGDYVKKGDILAYVHINHTLPPHWLDDFYASYHFTKTPVEKHDLIYKVIKE